LLEHNKYKIIEKFRMKIARDMRVPRIGSKFLFHP
jgi:hypothetical protein